MGEGNDDLGLKGRVSDALTRELGLPANEMNADDASSQPMPSGLPPAPSPTSAYGGAEGLPTGETHQQSDEEKKAQNRRNMAIAFCVLGFVVLVYLTTFFRLADNLKSAAGS